MRPTSVRGVWRRFSVLRIPAVIVAAIAVWYFVAEAQDSPFLPTPMATYQAFRRDWLWDAMTQALLPSVERLVIGFAIGTVAGIVVGVVIGYSRLLFSLLEPSLEIARAVPIIALLPVFIVFLGVGSGMRIAMISLGVFFPVLVNTVAGARTTKPERYDLAAMYQLSRTETLIRIVVPSALPLIAVGIRVSIPIGIILMVISELAGGSDGIGSYLILHQELFDTAGMVVAVLLLGILGNIANGLYLLAERKWLFWIKYV